LDSGDVKILNKAFEKNVVQINLSTNVFTAVSLMLLTTNKTELNACWSTYEGSRFRKTMHSALVMRFTSFYKSLNLW